ncbi:unnamed protein product [Caenorhabditis brenneri]
MKSLRIFILISVLFILQGNASMAQEIVNEGDEVPIDLGDATEIGRTVEAGEQTFYFHGEHKGKFVGSDGKEVDSSNYEIRNGTLIIKKFSKADVGGYSKNEEVNATDSNKY